MACFLGFSNKTTAPLSFVFLERRTGVRGRIPARDATNPCQSVVFLSPPVWEGRLQVLSATKCHICLVPDNCNLAGRWTGWIRRICELLTQDVHLCLSFCCLGFTAFLTWRDISLSEENWGLLSSPSINHIQKIKWRFSCKVLINAYFQQSQGKWCYSCSCKC